MEKKGLFIVMAKMAPEKEEAYNRWYNEEHLPRVNGSSLRLTHVES